MKAASGSGLISLTGRRLRRFCRRRPYAAREAARIGIELGGAFSAEHAEGLLQGTSGDFGGTGTAFAWASKVARSVCGGRDSQVRLSPSVPRARCSPGLRSDLCGRVCRSLLSDRAGVPGAPLASNESWIFSNAIRFNSGSFTGATASSAKTVLPPYFRSSPWRPASVSMKGSSGPRSFCSPSPSWWMCTSTSAMPRRLMHASASRNSGQYCSCG